MKEGCSMDGMLCGWMSFNPTTSVDTYSLKDKTFFHQSIISKHASIHTVYILYTFPSHKHTVYILFTFPSHKQIKRV